MAFSSRAGRQEQSQAAINSFDGQWEDEEGTVVTVSGTTMRGPDGSVVDFVYEGENRCSFELEGEVFQGTLQNGLRLEWNDGACWVRKASEAAAKRKFDGRWKDEEGTVVTVSGTTMRGPDGSAVQFADLGEGQCSFELEGEVFHGTLTNGSRLAWSDGAVWIRQDEAPTATDKPRRGAAIATPSTPSVVSPPAAECSGTPQTNAAFEEARKKSQAGQSKARQAYEAEKARKAAARERAQKLAAEKIENLPPEERQAKEYQDARARSLAGQDKARAAFEAEKARKKTAQERIKKQAEMELSGRSIGSDWLRRHREQSARLGGMSRLSRQAAAELVPGVAVRLRDLKARPELNGQVGVTMEFDSTKERWQVRLLDSSEKMLLKVGNLQGMSTEEFSAEQKLRGHDGDMELKCPTGHVMVAEKASDPYECDVCEVDGVLGRDMYYCNVCDYAMCEECSSQELSRLAQGSLWRT